VTCPTLKTYADKRADLLTMTQDLFSVVLSGAVKIKDNQTYPLRDAVKAYQDLQARKTTGSMVLTV
jgi:NADPH2:quinone reductase